MADDPSQLAARATWCRRLARDSIDGTISASLREMAVELDDRARKARGQA